ncbi:spore germination protein GerPC [Metabacillus herbersteinensis]|uniref:Spore germination protein GerPC n=1 Tax=Metabacillus herbersteinensis TaxID=283816 RepID=A0ABV6GMU5_9BACI
MYDVTNYLQQLYRYIESQNKRIQRLEEIVQTMKTNLDEMKNQPHTSIEKIEYKFDQLKIEHLAGTLNIGLNPTDPEQVENFEVMQKGVNVNGVQKELRQQITQQAHEELNHFFNVDCLSLVEKVEQHCDYRLDEPHRRHIIEDIRKQVDSRISYYVNNLRITENESLEQLKNDVILNVKNDVENSIMHFINHLPKEMKGDH